MSDLPGELKGPAAPRSLPALERQLAELRVEVATLRQELAPVQSDTGIERRVQVIETNARLVATALHTEPAAKDAVQALDGFTRSHERDEEPFLRDLREANEQLVISAVVAQELEEQTEVAHRQQVNFLAIVAHELRNPLAPIRTAAELLGGGNVDGPMLARIQKIIKRQAAHMSRLVEDLLDGSRVSAGTFRLERRTVDLATILDLAVETCRPAVDMRRQRLTIQVAPGPLSVHGDPVRLAQIFCNLLDNSSKYTHEGGEIELAVVVRSGTIEIAVSDNGIGISAEALPRIFDLFTQEARAFARQGGGLGIGLAVVRDLVQAHGGTVSASSAGADQGSRFLVTLPSLPGSSAAGQPTA